MSSLSSDVHHNDLEIDVTTSFAWSKSRITRNSNDDMDTSTINMHILSIQNVFYSMKYNDIRTDSFCKLLYT